jgi:DNA modification methylase
LELDTNTVTLLCGDCETQLESINDEFIDLIFTSPPYINQRKKQYESNFDYVNWLLRVFKLVKPKMKDTASLFINLKPPVVNKQRSLEIMKFVIRMVEELGFHLVDEYCWTKQAYPGVYPDKFKNSFEPIFCFKSNKDSTIKFNPLACGTPMQEGSIKRAKRNKFTTGASGMVYLNNDNLLKLELVRPSNVVNVNNILNQSSLRKKHPATFPTGLAEFFIKSFTDEGDTVLDLFAGSGTVGLTASNLNRDCILIEKKLEYCELISEVLEKEKFVEYFKLK